MKCLFVSDAHYPLSKEIVNFLLEKAIEFDSIYILGDLFEFYYGYRNFIYPHHLKLINTLKYLSDKVKITVFEGNHEYRLETLKEYMNVKIVKNELIEKMDDYTVYMAHGDTIDKLDFAYRIFRASLKNYCTLSVINYIPPSTLHFLSKCASKLSKESIKAKKYRGTEKALETFAKAKLKSGIDVVILGHTHLSTLKKTKNGIYINTGEFFDRFNYVTFENGKFNMKQWRKGDE